MSFNDDQIDYMRSLSATPPEKLCYCGWYPLDKCPNCPKGMSNADRIKASCPQCGNYPSAKYPELGIYHNIKCPTRKS